MESPFFDIPTEATILFHCMIPHLESDQLSVGLLTQIRNEVAGQIPDSNKAFNKIVWSLNQCFEQFLAHTALKKNGWHQQQLALQTCHQFALTKSFTSIAQKTRKQLKKTEHKDLRHFLHAFMLYHDIYFHSSTNKEQAADLLSLAQDQLDRFYLLSKLKLGAEFLSRENIYPEKHTTPFLEQLIPFAQNETEAPIPIYRDVYLMLKGESQADGFADLVHNYSIHLKAFEPFEQSRIFQDLINYAVRQYTAGNSSFLQYLCDLFQLGLKHRFYIEDGKYLNAEALNNIIVSFCLNQQIDEAYKILQTQKRNLHPEERNNNYNFCLAFILFHSKEFERAWALLNQTKFKNIKLRLKARSLRIRCYYEQSRQDPTLVQLLEDGLQNFRNFIRRSGISQRLITLYNNQIKVISALAKFDPHHQSKSSFKTKWNKYLEEQRAMAKDWLLKKIEEL